MKLSRLVTIYKLAADTSSSLTDKKEKGSGSTDYIGATSKEEEKEKREKFQAILEPAKEITDKLLVGTLEEIENGLNWEPLKNVLLSINSAQQRYDVLTALLNHYTNIIESAKRNILFFNSEIKRETISDVDKTKAIEELNSKQNENDILFPKLETVIRILTKKTEQYKEKLSLQRKKREETGSRNLIRPLEDTGEPEMRRRIKIKPLPEAGIGPFRVTDEEQKTFGYEPLGKLEPRKVEDVITRDTGWKTKPPVNGKNYAIEIVILKDAEKSTAKRDEGFTVKKETVTYLSNPYYSNDISTAVRKLNYMVGSRKSVAEAKFPINKFEFPILGVITPEEYDAIQIAEWTAFVWTNEKWKEVDSTKNQTKSREGIEAGEAVRGKTRDEASALLSMVNEIPERDAKELVMLINNIVDYRNRGRGGGWQEPPDLASRNVERHLDSRLEEMSNDRLKILLERLTQRLNVTNPTELASPEVSNINKILGAFRKLYSPDNGQYNKNKDRLKRMVGGENRTNLTDIEQISALPLFTNGINATNIGLSRSALADLPDDEKMKLYSFVERLISMNANTHQQKGLAMPGGWSQVDKRIDQTKQTMPDQGLKETPKPFDIRDL